jgi:biofilm PGA synthesis N-glycosyltransferase PgaC
MTRNSYVLISACRNEEAYLDGLLDAVAAQRVPPLCWVIVDDGSSDLTYERAMARSRSLSFLKVARMPGGRPRNFASQVFAAQHGYEQVRGLDFDFIGFLDADIRMDPGYYEGLLNRFAQEPRLGLAGGAVLDQYPTRVEDIRRGSEDFHVAGGVQFFRRECFEQIGGYVPIEGGGQDTIADVMAMMHGWRIRAFPELKALHLRPDGFTKDHIWTKGMKWGRKFYLLGYHPFFYFCQCAKRMGRRPILIGSFFQFLGFLLASLRGGKKPVTAEFVTFLRTLQLERLRKAVLGGGPGRA